MRPTPLLIALVLVVGAALAWWLAQDAPNDPAAVVDTPDIRPSPDPGQHTDDADPGHRSKPPTDPVPVEAGVIAVDARTGVVVLDAGARNGLYVGLTLAADGPDDARVALRITEVAPGQATGRATRPLDANDGWFKRGARVKGAGERASVEAARKAPGAQRAPNRR